MNIIRRYLRFVLMTAVDGEGGGGGGASDADAGVAIDQPSETPQATPADAPSPEKAPTMLDAINQHLDATPAEGGQPRDDKGRFAPKAGDQPAAAPAPVAAAATQSTKPAVDPKSAPAKPEGEDLLAMPDGLQPKAQERFQRLVAANKEVSQRAERAEQQVSYIQETFKQHRVTQPQFEQATAFIGAVNSGNLEQALQILDKQRAEIALALGKPLPGVDVLSDHPDLRQRVDQLQLDEVSAIELARHRRGEEVARQQAEAQRQQTQQAEQHQQAVNAGLQDIDVFCKQQQSIDLDYPLIEEQLLPEIQNLIQGVPPSQWKQIVETQYRLLKKAAASVRQHAPAGGVGTVLRAGNGGASPAARPRSAYEAMWGTPAPSA